MVERDGALIMVDDERMPLAPGETPQMGMVRFRTLGCYPLTGAVESTGRHAGGRRRRRCWARASSEREGRVIDKDDQASMERKKREGYF